MNGAEYRALILLSRESLDAERDRLELTLARIPAMDRLGRAAIRWRVYPFCYKHLETLSDSRGEVRELAADLRRRTLVNWSRQRTTLVRVYAQIRDILNASSIPFMFLRGIPLAERYYQAPHFRICHDVDLLVHEADLGRTKELLCVAGFRCKRPAHYRTAQMNYIGQLELISSPDQVTIDLNWRLTGNGRIGPISMDMKKVWDYGLHENECEYTLGVEDAVLDGVRHIAHGHDFADALVRACMDVSALLGSTSEELDWDYFYYQAKTANCMRGVAMVANYYTTVYAVKNDPPFSPPFVEEVTSALERNAFSATILKPLTRLEGGQKSRLSRLTTDQMASAARMWAADDVRSWWRVFRRLVRLTDEEVVLILEKETKKSGILERFEALLGLVRVSPGYIAGSLAFWLLAAGSIRKGHDPGSL